LVVPSPGVACTGARVSDLVGSGGEARKTRPEDVVYGSGADRLKVVWLPTLAFGDNTLGGALAVVRPSERFAEAYGVGGYRGQHDRVRFSVPRVGGGFVVAAEEDGCKGRKGNEACRALTAIYLPYLGSLKRVAEITTERYANIPANERGSTGLLE
jgi:hypothetical protein